MLYSLHITIHYCMEQALSRECTGKETSVEIGGELACLSRSLSLSLTHSFSLFLSLSFSVSHSLALNRRNRRRWQRLVPQPGTVPPPYNPDTIIESSIDMSLSLHTDALHAHLCIWYYYIHISTFNIDILYTHWLPNPVEYTGLAVNIIH